MARNGGSALTDRTHKEIVLPDGGIPAVIRKLTQRDFLPRGLLSMGLSAGEDPSVEAARQYLAEHPEDVDEVEERILVKGFVRPRVVTDPDDPRLEKEGYWLALDLGQENRAFAVEQIQSWSGFAPVKWTFTKPGRPDRTVYAHDEKTIEKLKADGWTVRQEKADPSQPDPPGAVDSFRRATLAGAPGGGEVLRAGDPAEPADRPPDGGLAPEPAGHGAVPRGAGGDGG
jgi:hypothetical protein